MLRLILLVSCFLIFICFQAEAQKEARDPFENTLDTANNLQALITLHYAKAKDLVTQIKTQGGLFAKEGHIAADERTNSIWVEGSSADIERIKNFLNFVDTPQKQILIKARIVNIDTNSLCELGVKFETVNLNHSTSQDDLAMDLPITATQDNHFQLSIGRIGSTLLDLELSALESEGHGKIISSPELITENRLPAYIEAGEEVPYQEKTSSGATNIAFKKAVLSLKVTPQITSDKQIVLNLNINQDKLSAITVQGVPAIQTRQLNTQVRVKNGQTLVLGGIYENIAGENVEQIPIISHVPLIGQLFKNKTTNSQQKELIIFVTPYIVDG